MPEQFDANAKVIQNVWDTYGLLTLGSDLLFSLLLPFCATVAGSQGNGQCDFWHSRNLPEGLDVGFVHNRWIRSVLNFVYQRVRLVDVPAVTIVQEVASERLVDLSGISGVKLGSVDEFPRLGTSPPAVLPGRRGWRSGSIL